METNKKYRKLMTREEYFQRFTQTDINQIPSEKLDEIYQRYLAKFAVFNRDNHTCQNEECTKTSTKVTFHHIKYQRNGGQWKERNGVTICMTCQKAYHSGKKPLVFAEKETLPPHIRGHTFWDNLAFEIPAITREQAKEIRKMNKEHWRSIVSWEMIYILMRFIKYPYWEISRVQNAS